MSDSAALGSPRIALIDHGAGNMVSMHRALSVSGADVTVVTDGSTELAQFDGAVLPGVGATGPAMATLTRNGLVSQIRGFDRPLLAVCVGMQLLFEFSEEDRTHGLGLLPGVVKKLQAKPLPHMGWNDVAHGADPVLGHQSQSTPFYFVHSFALTDTSHSHVIGTTPYGGQTFVSAVRSGNVTGLQFHPERSADAGLGVIDSFVDSTQMVQRVA